MRQAGDNAHSRVPEDESIRAEYHSLCEQKNNRLPERRISIDPEEPDLQEGCV